MNSGTHGSALRRECVFLYINFRAAWMLKTLETNLLGMFQKEAFVDGISPIKCTKRGLGWTPNFFQESLWPLRPVIEPLRSALYVRHVT
jgi:hypothetical protein